MNISPRNILLAALVLVLAASAALVAFAQEEVAAETSACTRHHASGYPSHLDALAELDITLAELRDHLASGGTVQELLADSDPRAERETQRLACMDELEANGDLTAEQAAALRAVIATGAGKALRDALGSHDWDEGGRDGWSGHEGRGGRGFDIRDFFGRGDRDSGKLRGFSGRGGGMRLMPEIFGGNLSEMLERIMGEIREDGVLSEEGIGALMEEIEEAMRSGELGRFSIRIGRGDDDGWHFDWFGDDGKDADSHEADEMTGETEESDDGDTDEELDDESEDADASANNSA